MFEKIKKTFGIQQKEERTDAALVQAFLRGDDLPFQGQGIFDHGIQDPYSQNIAVFRCINIISSSLSRVPLRLMRRGRELNNGKVYNLLNKPNSVQNRIEFINMLLTQLHISGNAFIYIDGRNSEGIPRSLMLLPPESISPIKGASIYDLEGWRVKTGARETVDIAKADIIHIKYAANPQDPIMGVGPSSIASLAVDTDFAAAVYNRSVMKNGGLPSGILSYKGPGKLTEEMKEEIRQSWYRTYGSPRASSRLAVTNSDWTFQPTGTSQKEMEFLEARRWNLVDIARAYNVPVMYLNDDSTSATSEASITIQRRMFYEENLIPLARKLQEIITSEFLVKIDNMLSIEFDFSNIAALQVDYNERVKAGQDLQKMGFSINQINERLDLGLKEEPWGDEHLVPVNMVPAQDVVDHDVHLPSGDSGEELVDSPEKSLEGTETASLRWSVLAKGAQQIEKKCTNKMRRLFLKQRSLVLKSLDKAEPDDLDAASKALRGIDSSAFAEAIVPFLISSYSEGNISALSGVKEVEGIEPEEGELVISNATRYCAERYDSLARLCEEAKDLVEQEISSGLSLGESVEDIQKRVRQTYNVIIGRSKMVSRTEVFAASNIARYSFLKADKSIKEVEWLSGPCRNHGPMGSSKIGESFETGLAHPGEGGESETQNIGCSCLIAAAPKHS